MIKANDIFTWERIFTEEDVLAFARVTGDQGMHHGQRDADGRLMVHGLLTASIPTKIGGEMDYVAREMVFEFLRPVFTGHIIHCEVRIDDVQVVQGRTNLVASGFCRNQDGRDVMVFRTRGVIPTRDSGARD
ncbi:MAG: enoyl-CoA hydratase [Acidobacteria bacterium]|nr:enoyl-CoA hydratase [Acidobacteriota bacterium]